MPPTPITLTPEQTTSALAAITTAEVGVNPMMAIKSWLTANNLNYRPPQVMRVLRQSHSEVLLAAVAPRQVGSITGRFLSMEGIDVSKCDTMIAELENAIVLLNAKKSELGG